MNNSFSSRLKSMLALDLRRMMKTSLFYIMLGISFAMPILILVMTTMMDGSVSVDPQTGEETIMKGFDCVWQIIGSVSGGESSMSMDLTSMCNINLIFFAIAVFVCIFVSADFRSGYAKNLFAVRTNKIDYVASKTITCFVAGIAMILTFFVGSMIGGAISGLSFALDGVSALNIIMCLLSKMLLMLAIVPIYLIMAVVGKQKLWLSILLSLAGGALLFTMIPMITPLNATILNAIMCLAGGALFSFGLGACSNLILNKTSLV